MSWTSLDAGMNEEFKDLIVENKDIFDRIMSWILFRPLYPFYHHYKEPILYLFFGGLCTMLNIVSFWLASFVLPSLIANVIAWTISVAFAYFTNRTWVFNTLQIYFDFSGYSDMAIGLGHMFGFYFLENFDYPYISTSITEFWRRWHISLGTWFRDYLYIPLGGNRCSKVRNILNLFFVWLLTGLWHGANITFLVWGMMYFLLLSAEKAVGFCYLKGRITVILKRAYTMFFVVIGWVIFRSDSMGDALWFF